MVVPFKVWRSIIVYILNPTFVFPIGAYFWSRYKGTYLEPTGLPGAVPREYVETFFAILGTAIAFSGARNIPLLHFTRPITFLVTLAVLLRMPTVSPQRQKWYMVAMGLGFASAVFGYFLDTPSYRNAIFSTTQSLIFLTASALELREILILDEASPVTEKPEFWFLSALLVLATGTLLFNATSNFFLRSLSHDRLLIPWVAVNVVYMIYYILMAKVFLCPRLTSS